MAMKDLAKSLTDEFSKAVADQEQQDSAAIAAIAGKLDRAYKHYSDGLEAVREKQISLGEQYRACLEDESRLQTSFERELQELHSQLAFFKHRKGDDPTAREIEQLNSKFRANEAVRGGHFDYSPNQVMQQAAQAINPPVPAKGPSQMGGVKRIPT